MASTASKHSSFELDESLGILTPDQMAESPLCDELPSLLLMSEDYQGYQGDGECSRPASPGKPNPMTDSDFFTESDADMHDELHAHNSQAPLSGDRKAQIIDGRLYGCSSQQVPTGCPSFLATEEMDSSGVYSDTDRTPRAEPEESDEYSPSKLSTLIMEQVNTIKNLVVSIPMEDEAISCDMEETSNEPQQCDSSENNSDKLNTPTSTHQAPLQQDDNDQSGPASKKHKMPKRNVVSKIKTMISSSNKEKPQEDRRPRRAAGCSRWDAVMTKIAQGQAEAVTRPSLKQVKSRVFAGMAIPPTRGPLPNSRKSSTQQHVPPPLKTKSRRSRTRGSESSLQTHQSGTKSRNSSRNSSISDLSKTSPHSVRSKKRESGGRSRSPQSDNSTHLASSRRPSTLPTTPPHAHPPAQRNGNAPTAAEIKAAANANNSIRKSSSRRSLNSSNNKPTGLRDQNRLSGGGGKTPEPPTGLPTVVAPSNETSTSNTNNANNKITQSTTTSTTNTVPLHELPSFKHASSGFEALGVLVQYLVYNLDAFSTPSLKKDLEKMHKEWLKTKLELEEAEVTCGRLQEQLADQKKLQQEQEIQQRHQFEIYETEHQAQIAQIMRNHDESLSVMENRLQEQAKELTAQYNQELDHVKESEQLALKVAETALAELRHNSAEELQRVQKAASQREAELLKRLSSLESNCNELKEQSKHLMDSMKSDKDTKLNATLNRCKELQDEVESLRTVLELRSTELQELRRQNETLQVDAELLPPTLHKLTTAQARVEDLEVQLERKSTIEKQLIQENRLLLESVHQESKQKKRLSQHNEELQWKLKQNSEVVNALVTDLSSKNSPILSLSPHNHAAGAAISQKRNTPELLEFFTTRNNIHSPCQNHTQQSQPSPPTSPKVKAVVEKNDSVSWVLEIDESPEHVVNRLVRRAHSFRMASSCSPSPAHQSRTLPNPHKRQRSRTSQSLCSSAPSVRGKKPARARSFSVDSDCSDVVPKWNAECENMETSREDGFSPVDRSDDNDDLIVVESVGDEVLSYIEIDAGKNNMQTELRSREIEISSSESEGSVRSRRKENIAACDELLLINRDDGLRERGILPKDAAGEAMISEETSDDDVGSRDSEVEDASSSSGDDDSLSGSASELANGIEEHKIKMDSQQSAQDQDQVNQRSEDQQESLKDVGDLVPSVNKLMDSNDITSIGMDLSWSEDGELLPSASEG